MWEKVKSNIALILAGIAGVLYLLFSHEKKKRVQAEVARDNEKFKGEDALLSEKQRQQKESMESIRATAEKEKGKKLSDEELEDFLKKL